MFFPFHCSLKHPVSFTQTLSSSHLVQCLTPKVMLLFYLLFPPKSILFSMFLMLFFHSDLLFLWTILLLLLSLVFLCSLPFLTNTSHLSQSSIFSPLIKVFFESSEEVSEEKEVTLK